MRQHGHIDRLLDQAQRERRCVFPHTRAEDRALRRRLTCGDLVKPFPGLFASASYWRQLKPDEQVLHQVRALALKHPSWVFAGPTAAAIHGLEHQWSIHRSGLFILSAKQGTGRSRHGLNRICATASAFEESVLSQTIPVTSMARTVADCANVLPFHQALPIADSAAARDGSLPDDVRTVIGTIHRRRAPERILSHMNPASENGGESLARGIMIEERFFTPTIQHVFVDPQDPSHRYRGDFVWFLPGRRILVAEYDGLAKYTDPTMTNRQSIRAVVHEQVQRERDLTAWGVTAICRFDYEDLMDRKKLVDKLSTLGVPRYPEGHADDYPR
ncbi:CTP synthase [Bifidobacterium ramosum]|uniref:CTP synthase n=1 Tax=Bifidobacterium ramosum TaxID=1798158 RepID=A0A6L4X003_9BIFI|nr:CTP synthase [Bifidobacterium ramosum]KAB8287425.1 CTP synthase [Bifidobacterium ramosum]NEG72145.1 CTP synthase [Bifidobacterium ramosum]